jgi:uncharacterized protein (DUF58 family)
MLPSRLLLGLLCVPVLLTLGVLFDRSLLLPVLLFDAAVLLLAGVDALWSRRARVHVTRRAPDVFSLGEPNRVQLSLRSDASEPLRVQVNQDLFDFSSSPDLPLELELPPRGSAEASFRVLPRRRGAFRLGSHFVRYPSRLRLWTRQLRIDASDPVRVYPDLAMIRTFELLARSNREYALVRATKLRGGETEFSRLRDYTSDDDYRSIDWKASARRQTLTAREYQLESDQNVLFMLDAGRLMTAVVGELSQFDHALNASLMLGHVATQGGDKVGLLTFDERVSGFLMPERGRDASRRLVQTCYDVYPRLVESNYDEAFAQVALRLRRRTLLVLFTQVVDDNAARALGRQVRRIARRHLPLVVLLRDTDLEAMAEGTLPVEEHGATERSAPRGTVETLYHRGAAAELLRWKGTALRELTNAGALVLEAPARRLTGALITRYLEIKARQLL